MNLRKCYKESDIRKDYKNVQ